MSVDWRRLVIRKDKEVGDDRVKFVFESGRTQTVRVDEMDDGSLRLSSTILGATRAGEHENLLTRIWQKNRLRELVGFRIDRAGRLVGEAWLNTAGLTRDELELYLRTLATASDELEHLLTGQDMN